VGENRGACVKDVKVSALASRWQRNHPSPRGVHQPVVGRGMNYSRGFGPPGIVHLGGLGERLSRVWRLVGKRKAPRRALSVNGTLACRGRLVGRPSAQAGLFLQSKLAVGWLPPPLAVRLGSFFVLEVFGDGTEFVHVATGEAGAIRSVPVFLQDHRAAAARTDSGRSCLHDYSFPPLDRVARGLAPA
jgi:hypothetical protein